MEILETYIKQIGRYPLLNAGQEKKLSEQIEKGSAQAVNQLVNSNLRLVISIARKFLCTSKNSIMDLIQEGNLGLMAAASKYHYSFNTRFSTYAYSWILQYMLRYVYNKTSMIALPHRKEELLRKVVAAKNEYKQNLNRELSVPELAEICGTTPEEIESVLSYSYTITSIDIEASEDGNVTIGDLIVDNSYNPEIEYLRVHEKNQIKKMVDSLPEFERKVIYGRYNFKNDLHVPTLRELSADLGVSAETVRQMELRAIKKMKKYADSLNEFSFA